MNIKDYFGNYNKSNSPKLTSYINKLDSSVKKYSNFENCIFKYDGDFNYYDYLKKCELNIESMNPDDVFEYLSFLFQNIVNWNNPGTMINVIPPVNLVALASTSYAQLYNPNFAQDTYAGLLITSELEVTKYMSDLVGWDYLETYGTFTFGGKGTNLYATKYAISNADPDSKIRGCKGKYFIISSKTAHPCHKQVCNWLGIGEESCIEVSCNDDGKIDVIKCKKVIESNIESGKIFLGFNLNGGNTNELVIDPILEIRNLINEIKEKYKLEYNPSIHVDSVLGWVFLMFKTYDFDKNELNISKKVLNSIYNLMISIEEIKYADTIGIDFHKTGFAPYISSLFLSKNKNNMNLSQDIELQNMNFGMYNPFNDTLELTRPCTGGIAALSSLKSLGINGYRKIIVNLFESVSKFKREIKKNPKIVLINEKSNGLATMFIIKPTKYANLSLKEILNLKEEEIEEIKKYNIDYSKFILKQNIENKVHFIFTSSRSYEIIKKKIKIGALKAFPMSVYLNKYEINKIVKEINYSITEYESGLSNDDIKISTITDNMLYYK